MSTFNFFIVISALMTTGIASIFSKDPTAHWFGVVLGASLTITSFVFWKLDQRVRFLLKHAESVLMQLEQDWSTSDTSSPFRVDLFSSEEEKTSAMERGWRFWRWHLTYSDCFGIIYSVFGSIGILACIKSVFQL